MASTVHILVLLLSCSSAFAFQWVEVIAGKVPKFSVVAGRDRNGGTLFVIRDKIHSLAGKFNFNGYHAYYSQQGSEILTYKFDVLVGNCTWNGMEAEIDPELERPQCGIAEHQSDICRVEIKGTKNVVSVGRVEKERCLVPYEGKENRYKIWDVLACE